MKYPIPWFKHSNKTFVLFILPIHCLSFRQTLSHSLFNLEHFDQEPLTTRTKRSTAFEMQGRLEMDVAVGDDGAGESAMREADSLDGHCEAWEYRQDLMEVV